mmetsp:Transcript_15553/g.47457  ORF Transcript_15553/g.47457 Transcript_15553/m.47457 type:complete len:300 (+) Transcript_15553:561-1460(+)
MPLARHAPRPRPPALLLPTDAQARVRELDIYREAVVAAEQDAPRPKTPGALAPRRGAVADGGGGTAPGPRQQLAETRTALASLRKVADSLRADNEALRKRAARAEAAAKKAAEGAAPSPPEGGASRHRCLAGCLRSALLRALSSSRAGLCCAHSKRPLTPAPPSLLAALPHGRALLLQRRASLSRRRRRTPMNSRRLSRTRERAPRLPARHTLANSPRWALLTPGEAPCSPARAARAWQLAHSLSPTLPRTAVWPLHLLPFPSPCARGPSSPRSNARLRASRPRMRKPCARTSSPRWTT